MNSAGLTSWCVATRQSGDIGYWCAVPSLFAGGRRHDRHANTHRSIHRLQKKLAGPRADAMSLATSATVGASLVDATELAHALLATLLHQAPPTEFATLARYLIEKAGGGINLYLRL